MNLNKAKEIFYNNFGSKYFMIRNWEIKDYIKCHVPLELEKEWEQDIKKDLMRKIISGENTSLIWQLSCMDISKEEKYEAYKQIAIEGNRVKILEKVEKLQNLFDSPVYEEIIKLLKQTS